jgi:hypothetical protein
VAGPIGDEGFRQRIGQFEYGPRSVSHVVLTVSVAWASLVPPLWTGLGLALAGL